MLILYNPPSSANRKPIMPFSLLALGALLEGAHDYRIVDGNLESDPAGALESAIAATGADVLAVTVMPGPQLSHAVPLSRRLKARFPALQIVWGGYFPTQHHDVCMRSPYVDFVVRGHAEESFRRLADALRAGDDLSGIAGLVHRGQVGEVVAEPAGPPPHPDALPDYPYDRLDMDRYARPTFLGRRTLAHHSSYGCPFRCNFCAVVNMAGGRWLAQSAERMAGAVRLLAGRWGADAVEFYDNNFFVDEGRTDDFAERIMDLSIAWWGQARIDTLLGYADQTWRRLRDSGLRMAFMGAESGSDETLQRMNKGAGASTDKTLALVERMAGYGVVPELSFVLGNPPDPAGDVETTLDFVRRIKRINPLTEIVLYTYTPVPLAGALYDEAEAEGFRFPETLEEWVSPAWQEFSGRYSSRLPWMDERLRRRIRDFERVLNARYPTATDARLHGLRRAVLRAASGWRYGLRYYDHPVELRLLDRLIPYRRPETSGF